MSIVSKPATEAYREGFDRVFKKRSPFPMEAPKRFCGECNRAFEGAMALNAYIILARPGERFCYACFKSLYENAGR